MQMLMPCPSQLDPPWTAENDRDDYACFLAETGLSASWVAAVAANPDDQVALPDGFSVRVAASPIHGLGMFATSAVAGGAVIAPARIGGKRTPAGRYVNHSARPNALGVPRSGAPDADVDLVALRPIQPGDEITLDYRAVLRANRSLARAMRRETMTSLVAALMEHGQRESPPVKHTLCNGMYMRELFIPAGTLVAGRVHTSECLNICSSGDIEIVTEHGLIRVGAGYTAVSPAYSQKLGYAYADTVWVNVFRTDLTDLGQLERALFLTDDEMVAYLDPEGRHFERHFQVRGTT